MDETDPTDAALPDRAGESLTVGQGRDAPPLPELDGLARPDGASPLDGPELEGVRTRAELERAVHDLQAENDRLRSSNAALLATNRELRSAGEERLRLVMDALPVLISYVDSGQRYRLVNKTYETWFGRSREEMQGRPLREVLGEEAYAALRHRIETVLSGERVSFDALVPYRTGGPRHVRVEYIPDRRPGGPVAGYYALVQDVGEQKRADAALREREAELARVQRIGGVGGLEVDLRDGFRNRRSPEYLSLHGLPPEAADETHEDWVARVHPEDRERAESAFRAAVSGAARDYAAEYRIVRPSDGQVRWIAARAEIERDVDGRPLRLVGAHIDVTDRKRAEEALARSAAVIEAAHEAAGLGVWSYDFAARILDCDARAKALFGFAPGEAPSPRDWAQAIHPDDRAGVEAEFAGALASQADFRGEFRVIRPGRDAAWVLAFGRGAYDPASGRALRMTGVLLNITKRRLAEEGLRESKDRFQAAVRAVDGVLWTNNAKGEMVGEQAGWAALTGQTHDEYQGYGWSDAVHPDDAGPTVAAWSEAVAEGRTFAFEHRVRTRAGEWRHFAIRAVPVPAADGRVREWVGVHTDISDRKASEERQALLIRELHHRVKNTLATVQAIVGSTARSAETVEAFQEAFSGRIISLARTHNLLTEDLWQTASLRQLLANELGPYDDDSGRRVALDGPAVELPSGIAVPIGMAIHELTTNAAKHGALSASSGLVRARWSTVDQGGQAVLLFDWVEEGGPPVTPPARQGFGSRLLQRVLATQLQARVHVGFDPDGLRFRMEVPLARAPAILLP